MKKIIGNTYSEILSSLADGVDPFTGEVLPEESLFNHPEVVRAFFCILDQLEKPSTSKKPLPENAGKPWSQADDRALAKMFDSGCTRQEMKDYFKRSSGAIASRLVRIGKT